VNQADVKFREGSKLKRFHIDSLAYLRDYLSRSDDAEESRLVSTGFLMQDGLQVVATIETLLDNLGVDGLCIAQKAQNDPSVVALECAVNKYLEQKGKGGPGGRHRVMMDTASAGEMELAEACGFSPSEMIVSHPRKTEATIALMKSYRPWAGTFDSEQELDRVLEGGAGPVRATGSEPAYEPTVMVRVKGQAVGVKNDLSSKFGVDVDEAVRLLVAAKSKGFMKFGVAFHVGTQSCLPSNYGDTLQQGVLEVVKAAKALDIEISAVDIGGGFPDARAVQAASLLGSEGTLKEAIRDLTELYWRAPHPSKGELFSGLQPKIRGYWEAFTAKHTEFKRPPSEFQKLERLTGQIIKEPWKGVPLNAGEIPSPEMTQRRLQKLLYRAIRDALDIRQIEVISGVGDHVRKFREDAKAILGNDLYIVAEPGRVITDRGSIFTPIVGVSDYGGEGAMPHIRIGEFLRGGLSGQEHDEQSWDVEVIAGDTTASESWAGPFGWETVAEEVFDDVLPVAEHVDDDAAVVFLAVVPAGALGGDGVAFEDPVSELAADGEDAAEESGVDEAAEFDEAGEPEFVLDDAVFDACGLA
jgi:hypothetical protein